eukprot:gene13006-14262_t
MELKRIYLDTLSNHLKIGIIGPSNVGKSCLYNILTKLPDNESAVDNSLFTTIDPSIGIVPLEDPRMHTIQSYLQSQRRFKPLKVTVFDTAGLIAGAFRERKGVGADSLECLKYCDVLLHVIRGFESQDIAHYDEEFDPIRDLEMVEQELLLMDLFEIEKKIMELDSLFPEINPGEYIQFQRTTYVKLWEWLCGEKRVEDEKKRGKMKDRILYRTRLPKSCKGTLVRLGHWDVRERELISTLHLYTAKETLYLVNITTWDYHRNRKTAVAEELEDFLRSRNDTYSIVLQISLQFEEYYYSIERIGRINEYKQANPLHISCTTRIHREIRNLLSIICYYTVSEEEIQAWMIRYGSTIIDAAEKKDVILARDFLRSEVISMEDFIEFQGDRLRLTMERKIRNEGRKYMVNDGDILDFFASHQRN